MEGVVELYAAAAGFKDKEAMFHRVLIIIIIIIPKLVPGRIKMINY